jgi:thymidylate kinase
MRQDTKRSTPPRGVVPRGLSIVITGTDGSGKTTLARKLEKILSSANPSVRYLHAYAWHFNLIVAPFILLRNKYIDKNILILDRSIFDNLAVLAAKRDFAIRPWMANALRTFYPRFDFAFYLHADAETIKSRRPDTDIHWHIRLSEAYAQLIPHLGHCAMRSDETLLTQVIENLAAEKHFK